MPDKVVGHRANCNPFVMDHLNGAHMSFRDIVPLNDDSTVKTKSTGPVYVQRSADENTSFNSNPSPS